MAAAGEHPQTGPTAAELVAQAREQAELLRETSAAAAALAEKLEQHFRDLDNS